MPWRRDVCYEGLVTTSGSKLRELLAAGQVELSGRPPAGLDGHSPTSTAAARAEARRLSLRDRVDDVTDDLEHLMHEMRELLNAALLTFEVVAKEGVGLRSRAVATLGHSLRRMRALVAAPGAGGAVTRDQPRTSRSGEA